MLTDFGIAKNLDLEDAIDLTGKGMSIGSPEYMAPEQWKGQATTQSDQYSLGVVLYEMLTGGKLYTANTPATILLEQNNDPLPRLSQFPRDLPGNMEKLLFIVLAKKPADRYPNMGAFAAALKGQLVGEIENTSPPELGQDKEPVIPTIKVPYDENPINTDHHSGDTDKKKWPIRRAWLLGVGAVGLLVILCGGLLVKPLSLALFPMKTPSPVQQFKNIVVSFQTSNIIQIGDDVYVIVDGKRRLIPNPETLDALGPSKSQINNKGFSDSELMTIPEGEDVPDVNRDPQGFADFKNRCFPNTTLIVPTPPPSNLNPPNQPQNSGTGNKSPTNKWQKGAMVGLCKGTVIRVGAGFSNAYVMLVTKDNWQAEIVDGPQYKDGVIWWRVSRKNLAGAVTATGWVAYQDATTCGIVRGESTQNNNEENDNSQEQLP
jgi:serine/threonine protein kinase